MGPFRPILLVDDSEEDVKLALSALKACHLANRVDVCHDGQEVLDYLAAKSSGELPAVIMLDLKMPRIDGLQVLGFLKQDALFRRIPTVMLTSSREEPDIARAYDLGANAYVCKPVDFNQFIEVIREIGIFWGILNSPPPELD